MTLARVSLLMILLAMFPGCGGARPVPAPEGEFTQLRRDAGLRPEQEVALSARIAARDAALTAWHQGAQGRRLLAAKKERASTADPARQAALDAEIQELHQALWAVRRTYRSEILAVLDGDQQRRWAGARLGERLAQTYAALGLAEEQRARIAGIAGTAAAATIADGDVVRDPYLTSVLDPARLEAARLVEAEVLSAAQYRILADRRALMPSAPGGSALATPPSASPP
jgi:hypothetical protein